MDVVSLFVDKIFQSIKGPKYELIPPYQVVHIHAH